MTQPRKLQHRALDRSDDVGAFMAALLGLAGILQLPEKLGVSADTLAAGLGFLFTAIAFVRGRLERGYREWLTLQASTSAVPTAPADASEEEVTEPREVDSPQTERTSPDDTPVVGPPPDISA